MGQEVGMKPGKIKVRQWKKNPWIKTGLMLIVTITTAILLMGCCMFYTTGAFGTSFKRFVHTLIESGSLSLTRSESNVLRYIDDTQNRVEGGIITQAISRAIPLHNYIVHADDIDFEQYVQAAKAVINENEASQVAVNDADDFLYYNGNIFDASRTEQQNAFNVTEQTGIQTQQETNMIIGENYMEDETTQAIDTFALTGKKDFYTLEQLSNFDFFIKNCYVVDSTVADANIFNAKKLITEDLTLKTDSGKPQILIYHTHSQETFYDSRKGVVEDSIVGVGEVLAQVLRKQYGIEVIHDTTTYDLVDGELERSLAYNVALPSIEKILQYNPSVEVIIDLHRDGLPEGMKQELGKRTTTINGEECAQIMLFNGLSTNSNGPIEYLPNPNLKSNLAFSLQLFLEGKGRYPDLLRPIYLKAYRFNLHLKPRSTLVELGTQYNTVEEAKNSMKYLAEILVNVLHGESTP